MADYLDLPIEADAADLADNAFAYLAERVPGWEPADGNLETWLLEAVAQIASEVRTVAAQVPVAVFRYYGSEVAGVPPIEPAFATSTTTWTVNHALGDSIPAGTEIMARDATGGRVAFIITDDAVIAVGETSVSDVPIVAAEAGAAANNLSAEATLVDALDTVETVVIDAATAGGDDGETDDEYLGRLVSELRLTTPRPILAADYAVLALRVAGVGRATALDNYDPDAPMVPAERMVAVAVTDENGDPVSGPVSTAVANSLEAFRETNFVVNVLEPTYTPVTVAVEVSVAAGWDTPTVQASVETALANYFSPATWGQPSFGDRVVWLNETTVRYLKVAEVAGSVQGVLYVSSLELDGDTLDVSLDGDVALPTATVTVTAVSA